MFTLMEGHDVCNPVTYVHHHTRALRMRDPVTRALRDSVSP